MFNQINIQLFYATENARVENAIRSKMQVWKMQEWKFGSR